MGVWKQTGVTFYHYLHAMANAYEATNVCFIALQKQSLSLNMPFSENSNDFVKTSKTVVVS